MERKFKLRFILLLFVLRISAHAQTEHRDNITGISQAQPDHDGMQMETQNPSAIGFDVSGTQEPENPDQKTGANLPVPDLLEAAKNVPARTLEDLEANALKNSPTLKQAEAITRASAGYAREAGLWPNPTVGYQGEQIRGGSFHGGEQGGFVQQTIVLGGKLGLRRNVFEQEKRENEIGIQEQQLNVRGAVRMQFYSSLARLRIIEVARKLLEIANDAASTAHQLANVGQADAPDVLQAEVEAEQAKLDFMKAQREYIQSYEELTAVSGEPQAPLALVKGDLDHPPAIDADRYLSELIENSPSLQRTEQGVARAGAELAREKHEAIPDLDVRVGVQQNQEILPSSMKPAGVQSFATVGIQIPVFNRNQGNVQAAQALVENQQAEVERTRLQLLQTAQPLLQQYLICQTEEERYRTQLIPRAQRAYELYLGKYRSMAAAYPSVIVAQRTLFQLEASYARTLGELWTTAVQLQSYLLADDGVSPVRGSTKTMKEQ